MKHITLNKVLLAATALALVTGPVAFATDSEAPGSIIEPADPSTVQVDQSGSLTTTFAGGNGFAGNTFDIQNIGAAPITITGWDAHLDAVGGTHTVDIYWRTGTSLGFEGDPTGWTLLGSDTAVVGAGSGNPSAVSMPPFTIQPGELFGFYLWVASYPSSGIDYTNGGPTTYSNSEISLTTFYGKGDPAFTGDSFFPREWNGTVYYDIVPVELQSLSVE